MAEPFSLTGHCPACGADWKGEEMSPEIRKHWDEHQTHYSRVFTSGHGIDCPDCGARFAWRTGERIA